MALNLFPLDIHIADHAVDLRSKYRFRTPDFIQLGTAVSCGADYILTNDKTWRQFKKIRVILIEELGV